MPLTGAAGVVRVAWEVVAADGDRATGTVSLRVRPLPVTTAVRLLGARLRAAAEALGPATVIPDRK